MIAYPFIYGKGRRFQYGVELISPALAPVARELEALAAYGSRTDSRSIRWGTLLGGDPYLSFAFSLPQGSAADRRAQVRVVTFVFPKDQGCPLTPALLQALPSLTLAEVEALARSGDTVAAEALCPEAPSPLPPPSSDFLAAVIATLFFQKSKAGRPALLARTDPAELLAALAALPPWLLEEVSFNTDVQAVSEPLQLLNVWTEQAKQYAERTNYSGAARNQRRFFYPQEEGVRLYVDGLEREAARFLRLSPAQQDALYQDCGEDLAVLIDRLHRLEPRPHQPPCSAPPPKVPPCRARRPLPPDLRRGLLAAVGSLAGIGLTCSALPMGAGWFSLCLSANALCFLAMALLGWLAGTWVEYLTRPTRWRYVRAIQRRGHADTCQKLFRRSLLLAIAALMVLVLLVSLSGWTVTAGEHGSRNMAFLLQVRPGRQALVFGALTGGLLWTLSALGRLLLLCRERLALLCTRKEGDLSC